MTKTITAVYQDCFLCGGNKEKGEKMLAAIAKKGYEFRKLSFATTEGNEYCLKAAEAGIQKMPFFTDGKKIAKTYEELINEPKAVKVKAKAEKKEAEDGPISES